MQRYLLVASSVLAIALPVFLGLSRAQAEDFVYWADSSTRKIQRASVADGIIEDLVSTAALPLGITLDLAEGKVYWAECCAVGSMVQRANLDGSNIEQLLPNAVGDPQNGVASRTIDLDLTNRKLYVIDAYIDGLGYRANLDGSNVESILPFTCDWAGIAVDSDGGKIYMSCRTYDRIERANLDGTGFEVLVQGPLDPRQIALDLDTGKIYWADTGNPSQAIPGKIQRANLDGTQVEDVVTGHGFIHGLALDSQKGKIYWSEPGLDKIRRANLNGSEIEDVVTGIPSPVEIALELGEQALTVMIDFRPGSEPNVINIGANGVVPVAVLSSETFDATTIDPSTIFVSSAPVKLAGKSSDFLCQDRDVDDDGLLDLVCEIEISYFILEEGNAVVILEASTFDGQPVRGTDVVQVMP